MAVEAPCTITTPTVSVEMDEDTGAYEWNVNIAGSPAASPWPYGPAAFDANGLHYDPTLGPGGLWVAPTVFGQATTDSTTYPEQVIEDPAADTTVHLDDGLPATWDLTNPSPHLDAIAMVYIGARVRYRGVTSAVARFVLQSSVEGAGGPWSQRDQAEGFGDDKVVFPSLNDVFFVILDPGETVQVAARIEVVITTASPEEVARGPIKLRALIITPQIRT